MADKAKHAYGNSSNLSQAISSGAVDAYDILLLDSDTEPKIGWVTKEGLPVVVDTEKVIVVDGDALPETGVKGKVYIFAEEGYFWNGTEFKLISKPTDTTELENQVSELETKVDTKVDTEEVQTIVKEYVNGLVEIVEF